MRAILISVLAASLLLASPHPATATTLGEKAYNYVKDKVTGHHKPADTLTARLDAARECCATCFNQHLSDQLPDLSSMPTDAWESIKQRMSAGIGKANDAAKQTADTAKATTQQAADSAAASKDHYTALFGNYWDALKDYLTSTQHQAADTARSTVDAATQTASDASAAVGEQAQRAQHGVGEGLKAAYNKVLHGAEHAAAGARDTAEDARQGAKAAGL